MVSLPPGSKLGRYEIEEQICRGGMATVFRAHDPEVGRHAAVKILPPREDDPTFAQRVKQD